MFSRKIDSLQNPLGSQIYSTVVGDASHARQQDEAARHGDRTFRNLVDLYSRGNIRDSLNQDRDQFASEARSIANQMGLQGPHFGSADVFRHAYVSAKFAQKYGVSFSIGLGLGHEIENPSEYGFVSVDTKQDLISDIAGASIGKDGKSETEIAIDIVLAIASGEFTIVEQVSKEPTQQNKYGNGGEKELRERRSDWRDVGGREWSGLDDRYRGGGRDRRDDFGGRTGTMIA